MKHQKTETERFIKDAEKMGYDLYVGTNLPKDYPIEPTMVEYASTMPHRILLDPLAWQAVAKTRGWEDEPQHLCSYNKITRIGIAERCQFCNGKGKDGIYWKDKWHTFIDHLADGKDIESALKEIT